MANKIYDKIIKAVQNGTLLSDIQTNSHVERHMEISDVQSLERTFDEVGANSTFENKEQADMYIEEAILFKCNTIATWVQQANQQEKLALTVTLPEEDYGTVGKGFIHDNKTNMVKEYATDQVRIVLRKNQDEPLGFTLVTAYPAMDSPNITPTGRDLREITKQTSHFEKADKMGQAYLLCRTDPSNQASISYKKDVDPSNSVIFMHVKPTHPNEMHIIKLKEGWASLRTDLMDQSRTTIETEYTQMTRLEKPHGDKYKADLTNPQVLQTFAKHHRQEARTIQNILQYVAPACQPPKQRMANQDRVAMAENLLPAGTHADTDYGAELE